MKNLRCIFIFWVALIMAACTALPVDMPASVFSQTTESTVSIQLPTTTAQKTSTPKQILPGSEDYQDKDNGLYTFTDLRLPDIKNKPYLLFTEEDRDRKSKYRMQLSAMDENGYYLGPLIKFLNEGTYYFAGTPDGSMIAVLENGEQIQLFNLINKTKVGIPIPQSDSSCYDISLSVDGKYLVVGCGSIFIAELPNFTWRSIVKGKGDSVYMSLSFSPDGKWLFSTIPGVGTGDDPATGIYLTDTLCIKNQKNCDDSTKELLSLAALPFQVNSPTWSNDSQNIAFVNLNSEAGTINLTQGKEIIHLNIPEEEKTIDLNEIAWSPDNQTIAYRLKNDVLLYKIEKDQHIKIRENVDALLFWIKR